MVQRGAAVLCQSTDQALSYQGHLLGGGGQVRGTCAQTGHEANGDRLGYQLPFRGSIAHNVGIADWRVQATTARCCGTYRGELAAVQPPNQIEFKATAPRVGHIGHRCASSGHGRHLVESNTIYSCLYPTLPSVDRALRLLGQGRNTAAELGAAAARSLHGTACTKTTQWLSRRCELDDNCLYKDLYSQQCYFLADLCDEKQNLYGGQSTADCHWQVSQDIRQAVWDAAGAAHEACTPARGSSAATAKRLHHRCLLNLMYLMLCSLLWLHI